MVMYMHAIITYDIHAGRSTGHSEVISSLYSVLGVRDVKCFDQISSETLRQYWTKLL